MGPICHLGWRTSFIYRIIQTSHLLAPVIGKMSWPKSMKDTDDLKPDNWRLRLTARVSFDEGEVNVSHLVTVNAELTFIITEDWRQNSLKLSIHGILSETSRQRGTLDRLFPGTAPIGSQWLKEHGSYTRVQAFSETQRRRQSKLMDRSSRWAPSHTAATKHSTHTALSTLPCSVITQPTTPPPLPPSQGWSNVQNRVRQQILRGHRWSRWQLCAAKRDSIKPVSFRRAKPQHKRSRRSALMFHSTLTHLSIGCRSNSPHLS